MAVRIRAELTGKNMAILFKNTSPHSIPLGCDASWVTIVVYDEEPHIVPWSIIFPCYLLGTYGTEEKLGNLKLPDNIVVKGSTLRVCVTPDFKDMRYNRWRLFDAKETG